MYADIAATYDFRFLRVSNFIHLQVERQAEKQKRSSETTLKLLSEGNGAHAT